MAAIPTHLDAKRLVDKLGRKKALEKANRKIGYWQEVKESIESTEEKLEVGKWYNCIVVDWESLLVNYQGDEKGFGFSGDGKWYDLSEDWGISQETAHEYIEASEQEVLQRLTKEAHLTGLKDGVWFMSLICRGVKNRVSEPYYLNSVGNLCCNGGYIIIDSNGQWATPLPPITKEEAEQQLGRKIV